MELTKSVWVQASNFPLSEALEWLSVMPIEEEWKGKKILDFGFGSGRDALVLASNGAKMYGVDIMPTNLRTAQEIFKEKKLKGEFKLVEEKDVIPYPDSFFDGMICNGVLHHIKHAELVVQEMYRVLKPGAIAYMMLYSENLYKVNINNVINMIRNMPERTWQRCFGEMTDNCNYSTFYSVWDAIQLFNARGFEMRDSKLYHDYQFRIYKLRSVKI